MTRHTPSWLQQGQYSAAYDRQLIGALWPNGGCQGLVASLVPNTMQVQFTPGTAAVPSPNSTGSALCTSDATETVTIAAAPPSGQTRADLICVQPRGSDWDGSSNCDWVFNPIQGTPVSSGYPAVPNAPAGMLGVWYVTIGGGVTNLNGSTLGDVRPTKSLATGPPIGSIIMWAAGASFPVGYLECNGQLISQTTYPDLYAILGTSFGSGTGTFALPNFNDRFPVGRGSSIATAVGATGGSTSINANQMPSHNHNFPSSAILNQAAPGNPAFESPWTGANQYNFAAITGMTTSSSGGGQAFVQPFIGVVVLMKCK